MPDLLLVRSFAPFLLAFQPCFTHPISAVFSLGHSWVRLSLHVAFPLPPGTVWALPILVRVYRQRKNATGARGRDGRPERKQTGPATATHYRTRPQLAREMIQIVAGWLGPRRLRVLGDSEYAWGSISPPLPAHTTF